MVSSPLTQHFYWFIGITVPIKIKAYVQLNVRSHFVGVALLVFTSISTTAVYHQWHVIIDFFSLLSLGSMTCESHDVICLTSSLSKVPYSRKFPKNLVLFILILKINVRLTRMSCEKFITLLLTDYLSASSTEVCLQIIFYPS